MKRVWVGLLCAVVLVGVVVALWIVFGRTAAIDTSTSEDTPTTTTTTSASTGVDPAEGEIFTATVTTVGDGWLLVEADEGGTIAGQVRVLIEDASAFSEGERVSVRHTGQMMPSLPPQLVATAVEKISTTTLATTISTVTPTSLNVSNYFIGVSTHPGNPTTAPSRTPNDKGVVNIVDWTTVYVPMYPMDELFYEDDTYTYHFSYWKASYVWVYYADGSILFIQDALAAGDVTPEDLEDYGIAFTKKRKGVPTSTKSTEKTLYGP